MENSLLPPTRYALVTGANKGIGFEICRKLAIKDGMVVILGSPDEKRGVEARQRLHEFDNLVFHQLDVVDPDSVAALVHFIRTKFGKLDILVNNAGISGVRVDGDVSLLQEYIEADGASLSGGHAQPFEPKAKGKLIQTYDGAKECIETNYYGVKRLTQALIPLLQLSDSPTIVNVSSGLGTLSLLPNEWAKELSRSEDVDGVDQVVQQFLRSSSERDQWAPGLALAAYKVSKAALNAYTRIMAKQHPSFCINAACPGYTRTDITYNSGPLSEAEAAEAPVKLALLPCPAPSGSFFFRPEALAL